MRGLRPALLACAALAAACAVVSTDLRYEPTLPVYALDAKRVVPVSSVAYKDSSTGVDSEGTGVILSRPFFDTFRAAAKTQLEALGVAETPGGGTQVEIELRKVSLERGSGYFAELSASVSYVMRAKRPDGSACAQDVTGWASQREGVVSSPTAQVLESALEKALDDLGPAIAESCLYSPDVSTRAPAAAAAAPARTKIDPKLLVVAIGIERYRSGLARAESAARDARDFATYAKSVLGAADDRVLALTDDDATLADLNKAFERWLPKRLMPGGTVVVYFAGLGAPDPNERAAYLLPYDGDPADLAQTAFPLSRLFRDLGRLPVQSTVILDAGFAGAGGRSALAAGAKPLTALELPRAPARVAIAAAASAGQGAGADKDHGLFTRFLLDALKEKGDLRAAFDAAKPQIEAAAKAAGAPQTPQWRAR